MKISFIGFGNMAKALAGQMIKTGSHEIFAAAPSRSDDKTSEGIHTHYDNRVVVKACQCIILAVKPDNVTSVLTEIGPVLEEHSLLISIAAGVHFSTLSSHCRSSQAIVRAMPNMPVSVGKGVIALIANEHVTLKQKQLVKELFQCAGFLTWLDNEADMDLVTAISGSGPAYLFYFLEAILRASKILGLTESVAKAIVLHTVTGAVHLAEHSDHELCELREMVTSKGGTTAAAINVLQEQGFHQLIFDAISAAFHRAKELGQ